MRNIEMQSKVMMNLLIDLQYLWIWFFTHNWKCVRKFRLYGH
jgi:hypothetical protein